MHPEHLNPLSPSNPAKARLQLTCGKSNREQWDCSSHNVGERIVVGSANDCAWQVNATGVSAHQVEFYWDGQMLWALDLDGSGCVIVDGEPIASDWHPLVGLAHIEFGEAVMVAETHTNAQQWELEPPIASRGHRVTSTDAFAGTMQYRGNKEDIKTDEYESHPREPARPRSDAPSPNPDQMVDRLAPRMNASPGADTAELRRLFGQTTHLRDIRNAKRAASDSPPEGGMRIRDAATRLITSLSGKASTLHKAKRAADNTVARPLRATDRPPPPRVGQMGMLAGESTKAAKVLGQKNDAEISAKENEALAAPVAPSAPKFAPPPPVTPSVPKMPPSGLTAIVIAVATVAIYVVVVSIVWTTFIKNASNAFGKPTPQVSDENFKFVDAVPSEPQPAASTAPALTNIENILSETFPEPAPEPVSPPKENLPTDSLPSSPLPAEAAQPTSAEELAPTPEANQNKPFKAVNLLFTGRRPEALAEYKELAQTHPGEPAYKAIARILENESTRKKSQEAPLNP